VQTETSPWCGHLLAAVSAKPNVNDTMSPCGCLSFCSALNGECRTGRLDEKNVCSAAEGIGLLLQNTARFIVPDNGAYITVMQKMMV